MRNKLLKALKKVIATNSTDITVIGEYSHCKNCRYYDNRYCSIIEIDDDEYTHNNHPKAGIYVTVLDDSGLDVRLRVSPDFGCNIFQDR